MVDIIIEKSDKMFKVGDYLVYKKDVCQVKAIKSKFIKDIDYYVLSSLDDKSLTLQIPMNTKLIRPLVTKSEILEIINLIPSIPVLDNDSKTLEQEYQKLLNSGKIEDLIKIIKTAFMRNKLRKAQNKKLSDKDTFFLNKAEKHLYTEFSKVLNMSYEETQNYVISKVESLACQKDQ